MKTKTKKCGVFVALAAVLLLSAALIVSCVEALGPGGLTVPQEKETSTFVPPPGKGYVMLNFAGGGGLGRTLRPDVSTYGTLAGFGLFDVVFTSLSGTNNASYYGINSTRLGQAFVLEDDTYTISVWAYSPAYATTGGAGNTPGEGNEPTKAIAYGTGANVLVVATGSGTQSDPIVLKELIDGVGTGTFTLAFTGGNSPDTAALTILTYPDGDPVVPPVASVNVLSQLASGYSATLPSGFYQVSLALTKDGHKSVALPEILYIYQGMSTPFSRVLPTLSVNRYAITWELDGGNWVASPATPAAANVTHGSLITQPTDPEKTNYDFDDWYVDDTLATAFDFGNVYPIGPVSIFAGWTAQGTEVTITVTPSLTATGHPPAFTITYVSGGTGAIDPGVVTFSRATPPVINIAVDDAGDYSNFVWWLDGTDLGVASTTNNRNFDFTALAMKVKGSYEITVFAKHKDDAGPESTRVTFTVDD